MASLTEELETLKLQYKQKCDLVNQMENDIHHLEQDLTKISSLESELQSKDSLISQLEQSQ